MSENRFAPTQRRFGGCSLLVSLVHLNGLFAHSYFADPLIVVLCTVPTVLYKRPREHLEHCETRMFNRLSVAALLGKFSNLVGCDLLLGETVFVASLQLSAESPAGLYLFSDRKDAKRQ